MSLIKLELCPHRITIPYNLGLELEDKLEMAVLKTFLRGGIWFKVLFGSFLIHCFLLCFSLFFPPDLSHTPRYT